MNSDLLHMPRMFVLSIVSCHSFLFPKAPSLQPCLALVLPPYRSLASSPTPLTRFAAVTIPDLSHPVPAVCLRPFRSLGHCLLTFKLGHVFAGHEDSGWGWRNPVVALHRSGVDAGAGDGSSGDISVSGLVFAWGILT